MFFLRYLAFQKVGAVIVEHALLIACAMSASQISAQPPHAYTLTFCKAFAVAIIFQTIMHLRDVYQFGTKPFAREFLSGFGQALLLASSVLFVAYLIVPSLAITPGHLAAMLLSISVLLTTWHFLVR